ncbi:MAG: hypothetical protein HYY03_00530 [Chloroflexi bacterium]|nr:hypothetical protein [Chloroflexota bacterium]
MRYVRLLVGLPVLAALLLALPAGPKALGQQTTDISLLPGWNLVSLPLAPADPAPAAVLASIQGKYNSAWAYQPAGSQAGAAAAATWLSYDPSVPPFLNTLAAIDVSMGLWLNMKEAATLSVSGSQPASTQIAISAGWNFIGYPSSDAQPIADVMGPLAYNSVWAYSAGSWQSHDPDLPPGLNTLQQFEPGRGYALNASAAGVLTIAGAAPSSFDLIDEALAAGTIDEETALVYKVYAVFGDGRLPLQYRGYDGGGPPDGGGVAITQAMLDTASPETRALLAPFLIPPIYDGSWLGPQGAAAGARRVLAIAACPDAPAGWDCRDATSAGVRVWWQTQYPEDGARAQAIASAMDATIWAAITGLMGQPLSDAGTTYDGGSPSVDIYLVDVVRSMAIDNPQPGCKKTPAYVNLQRSAPMSVVAHEFMHVLQWGFDVSQECMYQAGGEYNWLAEATAQWAEDFVYPGGNGEHYTADWYMASPGKPLDTADDSHEYGAYLFFQYLTKFYGFEQIVRTVWDNTLQYGSLGAVEQAMPGGFEERWAPFAACLWNRPPVDCFAGWDNLTQGVEAFVTAQEVDLGNASSRSFEVAGGVEHMAASYSRLFFSDDEIRSVVFDNTLAGFPHAGVQALAKIDGEWQGPLDWTDRAKTTFCRDLDGQHIEELVIIISNDDWENKGKLQPPEQPSLTAGTVCPTTVTLSWDADVADVQLQLWVLPQPASNLDEARNQEGQPGYDTIDNHPCDVPFQAEQSEAIEGVTPDAQYIAVYWWGYCVRDPDNWPDPPSMVPFTITIQYPDGRVETESGDLAGILFLTFGPYDFAPQQ